MENAHNRFGGLLHESKFLTHRMVALNHVNLDPWHVESQIVTRNYLYVLTRGLDACKKPQNKGNSVLTGKVAECVAGILIDDGMVLVEKRRADDEADPGLVMLPGGHVDSAESLDHALRREMKEELGIRVGKIIPVLVRYYTASNGERQRIHYFHIKDWKGEIKSREAERVYWEPRLVNLEDATERRIARKLAKQGAP